MKGCCADVDVFSSEGKHKSPTQVSGNDENIAGFAETNSHLLDFSISSITAAFCVSTDATTPFCVEYGNTSAWVIFVWESNMQNRSSGSVKQHLSCQSRQSGTKKYTNTQIHKSKYTNTNKQIQIHKYKNSKSTSNPLEIHLNPLNIYFISSFDTLLRLRPYYVFVYLYLCICICVFVYLYLCICIFVFLFVCLY